MTGLGMRGVHRRAARHSLDALRAQRAVWRLREGVPGQTRFVPHLQRQDQGDRVRFVLAHVRARRARVVHGSLPPNVELRSHSTNVSERCRMCLLEKQRSGAHSAISACRIGCDSALRAPRACTSPRRPAPTTG